jgi:serine/threonine protein kinase
VEYCNGGSLDNYLKENGNILSETEAVNITREILNGF